jgi:hypothetical protein
VYRVVNEGGIFESYEAMQKYAAEKPKPKKASFELDGIVQHIYVLQNTTMIYGNHRPVRTREWNSSAGFLDTAY